MKNFLTFICSFFILLSGCGKYADNPQQDNLISLTLNGNTLYVELADTPETRRQGLMFRDKLSKNQGMLFIFDDDNYRSFWMKNTKIPLSIAYIKTNGKITDILNMKPYDLRSYKSTQKVRYALEVNQNWFTEKGIKPNDVMNIPENIFRENR